MTKLDNLSATHLLKETCVNLLLEALIEYIEQPENVEIKSFIGMYHLNHVEGFVQWLHDSSGGYMMNSYGGILIEFPNFYFSFFKGELTPGKSFRFFHFIS